MGCPPVDMKLGGLPGFSQDLKRSLFFADGSDGAGSADNDR